MKTEIFTLCDFAAEYAGKLSVVGAFDSVFVKQVPAVIPQCAVALRLRCEKRDAGKHLVKLAIADAEGKSLLTLAESPFEVVVNDPAPSVSVQMSLAINGLNVGNIGIYSIELHIDGRLVSEIPFYVYGIKNPAPASAN
jgi:hypothetical protein